MKSFPLSLSLLMSTIAAPGLAQQEPTSPVTDSATKAATKPMMRVIVHSIPVDSLVGTWTTHIQRTIVDENAKRSIDLMGEAKLTLRADSTWTLQQQLTGPKGESSSGAVQGRWDVLLHRLSLSTLSPDGSGKIYRTYNYLMTLQDERLTLDGDQGGEVAIQPSWVWTRSGGAESQSTP